MSRRGPGTDPYRYPLEPLATLTGIELPALGRNLGISGAVYARYRVEGLNWLTADRYAVKAGWHPTEVWPTWHTDAVADADSFDAKEDRARGMRRAAERRRVAA